jgi:hypothetical protein
VSVIYAVDETVPDAMLTALSLGRTAVKTCYVHFSVMGNIIIVLEM